MSISKLFFYILIPFFLGRKGNTGISAQSLLLKTVTKILKKEISGIILKMAFALVATGLLIYSLISLGQYLHEYLLSYENGIAFSVMFFSLLSVVCVLLIFKLFYEKASQPVSHPDIFESLFSESSEKFSAEKTLEKIYNNFIEGLDIGMKPDTNQRQTVSDTVAEAKYP